MKSFSIIFILSLLLSSCASDSSDLHMPYDIDSSAGPNKYLGVRILNELPRGSTYTDSSGVVIDFRSTRAFITNDTLVPIYLQMIFSHDFIDMKKYSDEKYKEYVKADMKYKAFVLPDSMTSEKQFNPVYNTVTKKLEYLFNKEIPELTLLKKVIQPQETYTLNLGYLFKPSGGLTRMGLFSNGHPHNLAIPKEIPLSYDTAQGLAMVLGVSVNPPYYFSTISCGKITFK